MLFLFIPPSHRFKPYNYGNRYALAREHVDAGQQLISIESSPYEAEITEAEYAMDQAHLALRKADLKLAFDTLAWPHMMVRAMIAE